MLAAEQRLFARLLQLVVVRDRQLIEMNHVFVEPFLIGLAGTEVRLKLFVGNDAALIEVGHKHFTGLQATADFNLGVVNIDHTGFGGHDQRIVIGHAVTRRTQTVTVERSTNQHTVSKADRSRTIPRLHHGGVEFVESALGRIHFRIILPGFRNQHHQYVRKGTAAQHEHFYGHVQVGGIGRCEIADREDHFQLFAGESRTFEQHFTGAHPVNVTLVGVNFTVVGNIAERLRQLPGRERVG